MTSSSSNEKVMALEDTVRIIRDYAVLYHRRDNYIEERHAFLQKVIVEWYRRAQANPHIKKITMGLFNHKINIAMRILNITGLPMSKPQTIHLKSKCHKASLERTLIFESKALSITKIVQELLVKMGIPNSIAVTMYGPNIFEELDDDEDYVDFAKATHNPRIKFGKRKLNQAELPSCKSPRTSNDKGVWGLNDELVQCKNEIKVEELDGSDTHSETNLLTSEAEASEDIKNEGENLELQDVITVKDNTEDPDTATSPHKIIPDSLIKKEFETWIDSEKEAVGVVPSTVIKEEPDRCQSAENDSTDYVREMVDWIKKEQCESTNDESCNQQQSATLEPICSIKLESEASDSNMQMLPSDGMSTSTYFQNCVKQETEEGIH